MPIRLYDTASRKIVPFEPERVVRMYVCGITPYDSTHLGHAATYLAYDLLTRRLMQLGHEVRMVRNVTDVDDSILPRAREMGVPYLELAEAEITRFHADMTPERKELNLKHRIPLHREGTPEQVAEVVALLVTNDYITGETIVIDGGLTSRIA